MPLVSCTQMVPYNYHATQPGMDCSVRLVDKIKTPPRATWNPSTSSGLFGGPPKRWRKSHRLGFWKGGCLFRTTHRFISDRICSNGWFAPKPRLRNQTTCALADVHLYTKATRSKIACPSLKKNSMDLPPACVTPRLQAIHTSAVKYIRFTRLCLHNRASMYARKRVEACKIPSMSTPK